MALTEAEELELLELEEQESAVGGSTPAASPSAPSASRASQADVRASEPPQALASQEAAERGYNAALKAWTRTQQGQYWVGQPDIRDRFSKATGRPDPLKDRKRSEIEHARETGDVVYDSGGLYQVAKPVAAMAGFAFGGPAGATAAESLVRATSLATNLQDAVRAGAIDEDRAWEIFSAELKKGAAVDAAWNFGTPIVAKLLADVVKKVPGAKWLSDKVASLTGASKGPSLRDQRIGDLKKKAPTPERAQAVDELTKRVKGDYIPTPGQVTGAPRIGEVAANKAFPAQFEKQEAALGEAAEGMRREFLYPGGQPSSQQLGERVVGLADDVTTAVKRRLRPVFEAADNVGVAVNLDDAVKVAREALQKDAAVLGKGKLSAAERASLQEIVDDAARWPTYSAEATLDFISVQKQKLRTLNQDGKPTPYFETIVGKLTGAADDAYTKAARQFGRGDVVRQLELARRDYRQMNETVFDDAMKAALRKGGVGAPEDIGQYLWQKGKVSRPEQLDDLLRMGQREGAISRAAADKMRRDVTRGFLQEAVKDVPSAAKWTESLAKDPRLSATWETLTAGPAGKALRDGMKVLESSAQMVAMRDTAASKTTLPFGIAVGRAAQGGLGVSLVTGTIHPVMAVTGLGIAGTLKAMSTAYTHGDVGAINLITKTLRLRGVGTPAATKALQELLPDLEAVAAKYGAEDMLVGEEQEENGQRQ